MCGGRKDERHSVLEFLIRTHEGDPQLFAIPCLVSTWAQMATGYNEEAIEGFRRFFPLASIAGKNADLMRDALTAEKREEYPQPLWKYRRTFCMGKREVVGRDPLYPEWANPLEIGGVLSTPLPRSSGRKPFLLRKSRVVGIKLIPKKLVRMR